MKLKGLKQFIAEYSSKTPTGAGSSGQLVDYGTVSPTEGGAGAGGLGASGRAAERKKHTSWSDFGSGALDIALPAVSTIGAAKALTSGPVNPSTLTRFGRYSALGSIAQGAFGTQGNREAEAKENERGLAGTLGGFAGAIAGGLKHLTGNNPYLNKGIDVVRGAAGVFADHAARILNKAGVAITTPFSGWGTGGAR